MPANSTLNFSFVEVFLAMIYTLLLFHRGYHLSYTICSLAIRTKKTCIDVLAAWHSHAYFSLFFFSITLEKLQYILSWRGFL